MERACLCLNPFLGNLYQRSGDPMLVHADLHFWNVHIYRDDLYVIDFEDIVLGYPLHDIAICLYYLRNEENYSDLAAAFQNGYSTERDWPFFTRASLNLLWAARMTNFINYVAHADETADAREYINTRCRELEKLLNTSN